MRFLVAGSLGILVAGSLCAQSVISTHSGVVQYVEGTAYLADKQIEPKFGQFPDIKENQEFRTEQGRAEILLTPGVFLRLGENSSIRMLSTRLTDTRVEVLSGSAMIESNEIPKDNAIQIVYKNDSIRLLKQGLYRVDTEPARFQVFDGEAVVTDPSGQVTLKGGKQTNLAGVLMAENFDRKPDSQDALYRWSDRRASYVAQANVASASAASNSSGGSGLGYGGFSAFGGYGGFGGFGYPGYGIGGLGLAYGGLAYNPLFAGGWAFNPLFGMYTYMPYDGFGYSPFGYMYYSPVTVGYAPSYGGSGYAYGGANRVAGLAGSSRLASVATHRGAISRDAGFATSARSFGGSNSFAGAARAGSFGGARGGSLGGARGGSFGGARGGSFGGGGGHASMGGGGGHASAGGGGHR